MKVRVLRPGKPAVTLHWSDDYTAPMSTAYVSIEMDGDHASMLTRFKVTGKQQTSAAYHAVTNKDLAALMDVLDEFEAELPALLEEVEEQAANAA